MPSHEKPRRASKQVLAQVLVWLLMLFVGVSALSSAWQAWQDVSNSFKIHAMIMTSVIALYYLGLLLFHALALRMAFVRDPQAVFSMALLFFLLVVTNLTQVVFIALGNGGTDAMQPLGAWALGATACVVVLRVAKPIRARFDPRSWRVSCQAIALFGVCLALFFLLYFFAFLGIAFSSQGLRPPIA